MTIEVTLKSGLQITAEDVAYRVTPTQLIIDCNGFEEKHYPLCEIRRYTVYMEDKDYGRKSKA